MANRSGADPKWIADEGRDYGRTSEDAKRFVRHLARELNVSAKMTFPVYEDTFHYLWRENRLPLDVDPSDPKLKDPNERAMMIRTFRSGLGSPVGYVLPLRRAWWQAKAAWIGGRWPVRSEKVFLLPGDSPIGLRLPLDTLPYASVASQMIYSEPFDPTIPRAPLPPNRTPLKGNDRDAIRDEPSWRRNAASGAGGSRCKSSTNKRLTKKMKTICQRAIRLCIRRCVSNAATEGSTSSCRRPSEWRTTWI